MYYRYYLDHIFIIHRLYKVLHQRFTRSAGLTILAEAAYATGPALLGAPRLLSSIFSEFFCSLFQRGAPKNPSPPENVRPQNLKSEAPKSGAPNGFFPCFSVFSVSAYSVFQHGAPKSPEYVRPQNLKIEAPQTGASNRFFLPCFKQTAQGHKIQTARGHKSPRPPKAKP